MNEGWRILPVETNNQYLGSNRGESTPTMREKNIEAQSESRVCFESLEGWARSKMQRLLQDILEEEVTELLGRRKSARRASEGVVDPIPGSRNGHGKPRKVGMMGGTVTVRRPRVRDLEDRFESKVLPLFKRKSKELGEMLPELYLHGLSSGDFELALRGLLGDGAPLSASSIQRLKAKWELEYDAWKKQDLSELDVVYFWADGIYVKAGIEDRKSALLVIIGALSGGEKVIIACESGERESKESWLKVLRDLKLRGLKFPKLSVADGALGLWSALGEIHPTGEEQRCWNHKITNVLDDLPKKEQAKASELLKDMPYAATQELCEEKRDEFADRYRKTDPKAVATLLRDWERMVTFYSFPEAHWVHLRTSNIVESPFSAIRLRTDASRRYKRVEGAKAMIWKLLRVAEKSWRRLRSPDLLPLVARGVKFKDGVAMPEKIENSRQHQQERDAA
jgi:putative transposase